MDINRCGRGAGSAPHGQGELGAGAGFAAEFEARQFDQQREGGFGVLVGFVHIEPLALVAHRDVGVGGALGGLLAFRDQTLAPAQNALGLVAIGLASGINAQQVKGYDQTGAAGKPLFELPPVGVAASSSSQGTASLGAELGDISKLTASDFTLRRTGDQYQLLRSPDQQILASSTNAAEVLAASAEQGFKLELSGELKSGDSFLIRPTANAARGIGVALQDGRGIAAAASKPVAAGDSDNQIGRAHV